MTSDHELSRLVEHSEAQASRDMFDVAPPVVARALGMRVETIGGGTAMITPGFSHLAYNRALAFGLERPITEHELDEMLALFRRDVCFTIQPSPMAQPSTIGEWLVARGLPPRTSWVKWVRDGREPAPMAETDLAVRRVTPAGAERFAELSCAIFHEEPVAPCLAQTFTLPNWRTYMAWDGDVPVATAVLHVADGVGWLGWGATLESHRKRGAQSALIAARIRDARELGCRWLNVETAPDTPERPNPSYRNMARAGFRILYERPSHAWLPDRPPQP